MSSKLIFPRSHQPGLALQKPRPSLMMQAHLEPVENSQGLTRANMPASQLSQLHLTLAGAEILLQASDVANEPAQKHLSIFTCLGEGCVLLSSRHAQVVSVVSGGMKCSCPSEWWWNQLGHHIILLRHRLAVICMVLSAQCLTLQQHARSKPSLDNVYSVQKVAGKNCKRCLEDSPAYCNIPS